MQISLLFSSTFILHAISIDYAHHLKYLYHSATIITQHIYLCAVNLTTVFKARNIFFT